MAEWSEDSDKPDRQTGNVVRPLRNCTAGGLLGRCTHGKLRVDCKTCQHDYFAKAREALNQAAKEGPKYKKRVYFSTVFANILSSDIQKKIAEESKQPLSKLAEIPGQLAFRQMIKAFDNVTKLPVCIPGYLRLLDYELKQDRRILFRSKTGGILSSWLTFVDAAKTTKSFSRDGIVLPPPWVKF
jgi:hypothetical protein